jgi:hypothetical protein
LTVSALTGGEAISELAADLGPVGSTWLSEKQGRSIRADMIALSAVPSLPLASLSKFPTSFASTVAAPRCSSVA